MKHLKMFGFAALAAMALMGFVAGSASAIVLYQNTEGVETDLAAGSTIDFSLKPETKSKLTNTAGTQTLYECSTSTVKGKTTNTGSATDTVKLRVEELTWGGCSVPTSTDTKGELDFHWISGTTNATVTSGSEFGWTVNTVFFGVCRWGFATGNHLGVLTGSTSGTAELQINAIVEKQTGSEALCPATTRWVATYVSTTPDHLWVEEK